MITVGAARYDSKSYDAISRLNGYGTPSFFIPESIRDEKVKVIKAIQPLKLSGKSERCARYASGLMDGNAVNAYSSEEGIPADSTTETYGLRPMINNARWKNVLFYIRSGKEWLDAQVRSLFDSRNQLIIYLRRAGVLM